MLSSDEREVMELLARWDLRATRDGYDHGAARIEPSHLAVAAGLQERGLIAWTDDDGFARLTLDGREEMREYMYGTRSRRNARRSRA